MPGLDRTGPEGQGSQTGRRLGKCNSNTKHKNEQDAGDEKISKSDSRQGRGMARGFRSGKGRGQG